MTVQFGLNIVTLVMCIITLTMATAALMPQIKMGMVILRDGVLWALLLGIVGFVGFIGWTRLHEKRMERLPLEENATTELVDYSLAPTQRVPRYRSEHVEQNRPKYERPLEPIRDDSGSSFEQYFESLDVSIAPVRRPAGNPVRFRPNRSGQVRSSSENVVPLQPVFYENSYRPKSR